MRVDLPLLSDMTLGAGRRVPEESDAQLIVPSTLLPVVLGIQPTFTNWDNVTPSNSSILESQFITRTNQAAAVSPVVLLAPGLWEVEYYLSCWFNYVGAAGAADEVLAQIITDAISTPVMSQFAIIGATNGFQRARYLLRNQAQIELQVPLTGAGESLNARLMINAIKIL